MLKIKLLKTAAILAGIFISGQAVAQEAIKTMQQDYVKPFAPANSYRTWSVGAHGGLMYLGSFFGQDDFKGRKNELGYGAYIKSQILPGFGLQADFLRGKLSATRPVDKKNPGSFSTDLDWSAALSGNFTLANINFRNRQTFFQPYMTLGAGVASYKVSTEGGEKSDSKEELIIPVGAGFKINVAKGVNLDLGYKVNFVNSDKIDGVTGGSHDKFSYAFAGLEFALGDKTKPQLAAHNAVADLERDYVQRYDDLKQQLEQERNMRADLEAKFNRTLVDSDGDGVIDLLDKCPNTPPGEKVDGSGCPLPKQKAPVKIVVTEEDKRVVNEAIRNLEFDFGKASIRSTSFPSLNRVAELLINKNFSLKLAGHTDDVGSDQANLRLSKNRAESVKQYLVQRGANPSRIEATGYGESQPIASNATEAGRQQNRRVEFTLF